MSTPSSLSASQRSLTPFRASTDNDLVIGVKQEGDSLKVITAPNNFYGKVMQMMFGDKKETIASAIATSIQKKYDSSSDVLPSAVTAAMVYKSTANAPISLGELKLFYQLHESTDQVRSAGSTKSDGTTDSETNSIENRSRSSSVNSNDSKPVWRDVDSDAGTKSDDESNSFHGLPSSSASSITLGENSVHPDEIPEETTAVAIEPEKELEDFLNEQKTKAAINSHLDAASTSLANATQSADESDPLTKILTDLREKIANLKSLIGVPGQNVEVRKQMFNLMAELKAASWPAKQQLLLEDIKASVREAQKLVIGE